MCVCVCVCVCACVCVYDVTKLYAQSFMHKPHNNRFFIMGNESYFSIILYQALKRLVYCAWPVFEKGRDGETFITDPALH